MWTRNSVAFVERSCTRPRYSFYHDLIPAYWSSSRREGETGPLRWICTLARKMGVRSLTIEDARAWPEVKAELDALEAASPGVQGCASAVAITFLSRRYTRNAPAPGTKDVIGQAVVLTYPRPDGPYSYVFEANFRVPARNRDTGPLMNNYVPMAREVEVRIRDRQHRFAGIYFCEQNGLTTLCAHSALRTIAHAVGKGRLSTAEVQRLLGPATGDGGVMASHLRKAIEGFGPKARLYTFGPVGTRGTGDEAPDTPWGVLTSAIEAGHPALLIVKSDGPVDHVMPVLGYTLNTDEWHPHAADLYREAPEPFLSSSHWVDHLIINDDLAGPYYCLAQAWASASQGAAPLAVITVIPEEADVTPALAEPTAHLALTGSLLPEIDAVFPSRARWWRYLVDRLSEDGYRPVLRTTLAARADYLAHLAETAARMRRTLDPDIVDELAQALPPTFWLCEVSLPNLYVGNRAKLGEIIVRPSPRLRPDESALELVVGFRLPTVVGWRVGDDLLVRPCALDDHARLIGSPGSQEW